ncbi:GDSL family lipase [Salipiger aestuarii]|uniref:Acyl-CoA thioesterase-1 n=2 Tax=Salipiger aestuarii TaxID=568098 RepID=A0A327XXK1_9RHOB|nr:GDSL family lipase [Salipiger aestuarii]RAK13383.1 acyl-CoA thioesterase-1 [Salipiger aestuarii]
MMNVMSRYGAGARVHKLLMALICAGCFATPPAAADEVNLLALGDSLTQGYGLVEGDGFVPQLHDWLRERGHDVRIVNGGVSGDTTAGGLSRADWSLTPDIDGMILTLGGNDLLRGLDPSVTQRNLNGILSVAEAKGVEVLLVGLRAPGNYGPAYKAAFDAIYPDIAKARAVPLYPDFFAGILPEGGTPSDAKDLMQQDGIHPNAAGVALIVEAIGPTIEQLIARIESGG